MIHVRAIHVRAENRARRDGRLDLGGDLTVHRLGLGAMRITGDGIWSEPADRAEAKAVLRRAIELGVNFIDTADSYGPHVSEQLIGETLYPYPDDLVIATKGGLERPGPGRWPAQRYDATPRQIVLAWLLARSPQILPIPGTGTASHLEDNVAAAAIKLAPADGAALTGN